MKDGYRFASLPRRRTDVLVFFAQLTAWGLRYVDAQECIRPSTAGYDFTDATETLSGGSFSVSGVVCSSGYAGTVTATACSADQGDYSVSGCTWLCAPPPLGSVPDGDGVVNVVEGDRSYSSTWENDAPGGTHARSMLDSAYGWSPADTQLSPGNDWVQMDLGVGRSVSGIVSQGRGDGHDGNQWVTTYKVQYSVDGVSFEEIDGTFSANTDQTTKVTNNLADSVIARYVRILPYSTQEDNHVAMRVGVVVDDVEACWTCERPSTAGYDFTDATETLSGGDSFSVSGVVCSSGYTG
eukprot:COSAG02_NODE_12285_length_1571_cov_12.119809_1_plen_295_part_10